MTNDSIEILVRHEFKELYSANLRWLLHKTRWFLFFFAVIVVFIAAVLIYAETHHSPDFDSAKIINGFESWYFIVPMICVLIPLMPFIAARKAMRDPRTKAGFKYRFSRDAIQLEGAAGKSELNWAAFVDVREVPAAVFLFINRQFFHLIPKRCFTTPQDLASFREILRDKFPRVKSLRAD